MVTAQTYTDTAKAQAIAHSSENLVAAKSYSDANLTTALEYTDAAKTESFGYTDKRSAETLDAANSYTDFRINNLEAAFVNERDDLRAGVAGAIALAGLPQAVPGGRGTVSLSGATYRGETAFALGASTVVEVPFKAIKSVTFKMGATADSRNNNSGQVGIGLNF